VRIDETFDRPRTTVSVVAIGAASEAALIRSALESLGAAVHLHLIGTPDDLLRVLAMGDAAPRFIVLSAHGDDMGFVFGDYGPGIDIAALEHGSMSAHAISGRIRLPGRTVVSTACGTGSDAFAAAFLQGGVADYIAPRGYPEGADAAIFVHLLFHQLLTRGRTPEAALREVRSYDAAFEGFHHFRAD
jgi:hypothetical protein